MNDLCVLVMDRYVGDDWVVGPITLSLRYARFDLTGATVTALVYVTDTLAPVATLTEIASENGGIKVATDRITGTLTEVWVSRSITAGIKPQDRRSTQFPTRVCILVEDSSGRLHTGYTILFRPLDRRMTLCSSDSELINLQA